MRTILEDELANQLKLDKDVWEEKKILILDFNIPLPIDKERKLTILLSKKELEKLWNEVSVL